jgi:hypothetical protein
MVLLEMLPGKAFALVRYVKWIAQSIVAALIIDDEAYSNQMSLINNYSERGPALQGGLPTV